ncbi:MAG: acetylglutamate kinase [Candidatus Woesearchaeota archaeon]
MDIIKIGGGKNINIKGIIRGLNNNNETIIVHGANAIRDNVLSIMGYEKNAVTSIMGYSSVITDDNMMDVIMMTYSGIMNKRIVELCHQNSINAIGLSGIDGGLIRSKRNNGIRIEENGRKRIIRDLSGKSKEINEKLLRLLLKEGYTPVISIPTLDEQGHAINTENDDIIALLHHTLRATRIIQLIEAPGYLKEPGDENSLIRKMRQEDIASALGKSTGRMKRKLHAIKKMLEVPCTIHIADGRTDDPLGEILRGEGTVIRCQ